MDTKPAPFEPPAPKPRAKPPTLLQMLGVMYRNPLELWGEPSYNEPWISIRTGVGGPLVIANDPGLVRHIWSTMRRTTAWRGYARRSCGRSCATGC
jgi:hypothetical protein